MNSKIEINRTDFSFSSLGSFKDVGWMIFLLSPVSTCKMFSWGCCLTTILERKYEIKQFAWAWVQLNVDLPWKDSMSSGSFPWYISGKSSISPIGSKIWRQCFWYQWSRVNDSSNSIHVRDHFKPPMWRLKQFWYLIWLLPSQWVHFCLSWACTSEQMGKWIYTP